MTTAQEKTARADVPAPEGPGTPALPAHAQLLLALARPRLEAVHERLARSLADQDDLDWGAFLDAAARHKLLPLVGRHVFAHRLDRDREGLKGFPYSWVFTTSYLGNRVRNQALADDFGRVFRELGDAGVRHAVRKGFSLAEGEYSDPALRRINDVDLLVDRDDVPQAHEVLERLGYVQGKLAEDGEHIVPFSRKTQIFWRVNLSNQLPYRKAGNRPDVPEFNVDLCHDIFQKKSGVSAPARELLDRSVSTVLCGAPTWVPEPADRLLDLCSHLYKEATSLQFIEDSVDLQISKFLDVALVAASYDESVWHAFLSRVGEYEAGPIAYYALHFTAELYPDAVPPEVLAALRPEDTAYLDQYGTLDGQTARWALPFLERLFDTGRGDDSEPSNVPHD
ncbi:nucleotidyltransferase family protein [Streptomyces marianii]|uniref:Nucleotidyltransferase family protein n=1 Tax=Streptomyces marianii TaxID=1817406 RepID=A0A5R9E8M4_9ACTN|nr:nucleotidyltransferase family protein [Streptomyces marianii]TLQ46338.1 nucleotidyltransferase family protein [Streptomyces marianii]